MGWYIGLGTVPIAILGFIFRDQIESGGRNLYLIGCALIALGFLLLYAEHIAKLNRDLTDIKSRDATVIGTAQALALIPGVSRSGSTITAGCSAASTASRPRATRSCSRCRPSCSPACSRRARSAATAPRASGRRSSPRCWPSSSATRRSPGCCAIWCVTAPCLRRLPRRDGHSRAGAHCQRRDFVAFPHMAVHERVRMAPSIFRLPVEKLRDGYYSDAYFNLTKSLLEADDHHPHVVMQVFQRKESILGGVDEAIAVLKPGAGHYEGDQWVDAFDSSTSGAARGRRDLPVGDRDDDRGRLRGVRAPRDRLSGLHGAPHADHAQRARGRRRRARQADPATSPPATTTGSCRPATAGRRTSAARSASPPTRRRPGGAAAASAPSRTG